MLTAYHVLSAIVILALLVLTFMTLYVEKLRRRKETGSKKYEFCLRLRNNEVYLIGLCYPVRAILGLLLGINASVNIVWGIVWSILAFNMFKEYGFGWTSSKAK